VNVSGQRLVGRALARAAVVLVAACGVAAIAYAAVSLLTGAGGEAASAASSDVTSGFAAGIDVLVKEIGLIGATALFGRKVLRLRR
jgi:hypothetical protein